MMKILRMTRTFRATIEERDDNLDTWILKREKMANSHKGFFTKKTKNIFNFAFDYDIPGIFNSEFYNKLPGHFKEEAFEGPAHEIKSKFNIFFRLIDRESSDILVHHMCPKQYVKDTRIIEAGKESPGLWFIMGGSVKCTHFDNPYIDLIEYNKGMYFGDICLLNEVADRTFIAGEEGVQCLYLDYQNFLDIMDGQDEVLCKLRSIYIYKSVSVMVEEAKFEDVTREVVDTILNAPELKMDLQRNKRKV